MPAQQDADGGSGGSLSLAAQAYSQANRSSRVTNVFTRSCTPVLSTAQKGSATRLFANLGNGCCCSRKPAPGYGTKEARRWVDFLLSLQTDCLQWSMDNPRGQRGDRGAAGFSRLKARSEAPSFHATPCPVFATRVDASREIRSATFAVSQISGGISATTALPHSS